MTLLSATADVALADAGRYFRPICEHLAGHGDEIDRLDRNEASVRRGSCNGRMRAMPDRLLLTVEATELAALLAMRASLASHLLEFAGSAAGPVLWEGDGSTATVPPEFRELRVAAVEDVTPMMRRIRLEGSDLGSYATSRNLHCKLLFAPNRARPVWPWLGSDGIVRWPEGEDHLTSRKYTIRRIDPDAGYLDIDFVRHADAGVGSSFAEEARPGYRIGMIGPGGLGARPAAWMLLAGDETALPAIARILEEMAPETRGLALIEIADAAERQSLRKPERIDVRWLSRDGAPAGTTALLADALRSADWPTDRGDVFVWVGAEFTAFREIRRHLRAELRLPTAQQHVVAYWRRSHGNY